MKLGGVATWTRTVRHSDSGSWLGSAFEEFSAFSGKLVRQETYALAPAGDDVRARSRWSGPGSQQTEHSWQFKFSPLAAKSAPRLQNEGCTVDELRDLTSDLQLALTNGLGCMRGLGRTDMAALILARYQRGPVVLACVNSVEVNPAGFLAGSDGHSYLGVIPATRLSFDRVAYFRLPQNGRIRTLWHELLHLWTGPHAPGFSLDAHSPEQDRTNACVSSCFDGQATRCACARCLAVSPGDARCGHFKDCGSPLR